MQNGSKPLNNVMADWLSRLCVHDKRKPVVNFSFYGWVLTREFGLDLRRLCWLRSGGDYMYIDRGLFWCVSGFGRLWCTGSQAKGSQLRFPLCYATAMIPLISCICDNIYNAFNTCAVKLNWNMEYVLESDSFNALLMQKCTYILLNMRKVLKEYR